MKKLTILLIALSFISAHAQTLWERNENLVCVETKSNLDEIREQLKKKYGRDCDYLRDATRSVIGSIFKCPGEKMHPYFRTKEACSMFFAEGKKDLLKFAPVSAGNPKKWNEVFGKCMETATQKQLNSMGLKTLNTFCYCVASTTKTEVTQAVVQECSKKLN